MCYKELLIFLKESTSSIEEDQNKVGILNQSKDSHDDSLIEAGNIAVCAYFLFKQKDKILNKFFAGSLESANWSILAPREVFKEVVGKNQDFMLIRLVNVNDLIGCGGDT